MTISSAFPCKLFYLLMHSELEIAQILLTPPSTRTTCKVSHSRVFICDREVIFYFEKKSNWTIYLTNSFRLQPFESAMQRNVLYLQKLLEGEKIHLSHRHFLETCFPHSTQTVEKGQRKWRTLCAGIGPMFYHAGS